MHIGYHSFSAIIVATALILGGCSSNPPKTEEPQPAMRVMGEAALPPATDKDATPTPTNESIGFEIRRLFNADPSNTAGIIVEVDDGIVTLRGAAPSTIASFRAQGMANAVKGVKSVVNLIAVKNPNVPP